MADLPPPVTDPALIQQLEAGGAAPNVAPADANTAAALDAMAAKGTPTRPFPDWDALFGNPQAQNAELASSTAALRSGPLGGIARGLRDPLDQGAALLTHAITSIAPAGSWLAKFGQGQQQNVAAANAAGEKDYAENWRNGQVPATDWSRMIGEAVATAPLAYAMPGAGAAGLLPRIASGAAAGAASGALQPVDASAPDFWEQTLRNVALGGAGGGVAPAVVGGISRAISPTVSPDVTTLMAAGVRPTPGQLLGPAANRLEEGATSLPLIGDFIKSGRAGAVRQFNEGAINQALAPIGETLEAPLGRGAINEMQTKIDDFYDALTPHLGISAVDPLTGGPSAAATQLNSDIGKILSASRFMPPDRATQLKNIIQAQIYDKMSPAGGMTGESWQEAKSELGRLATGYMNSITGDERQLGGALLQTQVAMRNALRTANPAAADQLGKADAAYAQMLRVNNAAGRPGADPGVFSPAQLQAATKAMDPSLRKHVFAAGDALMQNYAEAGKAILGNKVPDSGTPFRHAVQLATGALVGEHVPMVSEYALPAALGYGGLGALAGAVYSPLGRAAIAHAMTSRPSLAAPIAGLLRQFSPAASAAAPAAYGALAGP